MSRSRERGGMMRSCRARPKARGNDSGGALFESATRASAHSDLYSLGICAYYLLTGAPPFSGGATMDIGRAHLTEPPPPLMDLLGEPVDPDLEAAIAACVRKEPNARPSSANALITLLNRSTLAQQWTQADAFAWWQQNWPVLRLARVSSTPRARSDRSCSARERESGVALA